MVLLQQGYSGSVLDPAYIRLSGTDYKISELQIVQYPADGLITLLLNGAVLFEQLSYDLFTIDDTDYTPLSSYQVLIETLATLNLYQYPGVKAKKLRSLSGINTHMIKPGATSLYSIIALNGTGNNAFLKIYDMDGTPDVLTDIPVMTFDTRLLPAAPLTFGTAVSFQKGLALAITGASDDNDNTPVAAGDVIVTMIYE